MKTKGISWNWREEQIASSWDLWEGNRAREEVKTYRVLKMKIAGVEREGKSHEIKTVLRIDRTDS